MIDFVARAMQITCMIEKEIKSIQKLERFRGYCIPNWNIQSLSHLNTIKETLGIPDDQSALTAHATRVENDLLGNEYTKLNIHEERSGVDWCHSFDWMVFNNPKGINFQYQGRLPVGNIKSKLKNAIKEELDFQPNE